MPSFLILFRLGFLEPGCGATILIIPMVAASTCPLPRLHTCTEIPLFWPTLWLLATSTPDTHTRLPFTHEQAFCTHSGTRMALFNCQFTAPRSSGYCLFKALPCPALPCQPLLPIVQPPSIPFRAPPTQTANSLVATSALDHVLSELVNKNRVRRRLIQLSCRARVECAQRIDRCCGFQPNRASPRRPKQSQAGRQVGRGKGIPANVPK
ncbi:unnamed protein product [Protopolystoma xenopodis]|uniref:Secreted protein n=1 Tax=Protopolystoma xenopodis TaxID=117903 RepID=A0A3S5CV44_9PLAT|nr:unnamed protein product [Protopolystoma xenopodis]